MIEADGARGKLKLARRSGARQQTPTFSPDGQRIAFRSHGNGPAEIYVMNADGSGQTNLTNGRFADRRPDWQPIVSILTVNLGGSGTGSVTGPGIVPGDCTETYAPGTSVTLSAAGTGGSHSWVGAGPARSRHLVLTMVADKVTTATVNPPPCKGKLATIVGTSSDVRKGTPGKDVIVGLGGNDYKLSASPATI